MSLIKIFFISTLFVVNTCKCRQTYITICDNFKDTETFKDLDNIDTLMIGSEHGDTKPSKVSLQYDLRYYNLHKVSTLMIVRAISDLEWSRETQCKFTSMKLKSLIMYGNNLTTIKQDHFPDLHLKKLTLVNNRIETIEALAFSAHSIETIDLSENLLQVLERNSLPRDNVTKVLTAKNNKLTHIEAQALPESLTSLDLTGNQFRYIQNEVLHDLPNLQELVLSRNHFTSLPKVNHFRQLVIFDISYNKIITIKKGTFKKLHKLKFLDLSNNKIDDNGVLEWIVTPGKQPDLTISLAFNRLGALTVAGVDIQQQTFVLYGNPWDCLLWPTIKGNITGHESSCELEFLSNTNAPYCVNYGEQGLALFDNTWDEDIDRLHDRVRESERKFQCSWTVSRNRFLYPVDLQCIY